MNPRPLHPGAWWLWAIGMAAAVSRTTNPLLLALAVGVVAVVVSVHRSPAAWGRSFGAFLRLGVVVVVLRVLFEVLFGPSAVGSVLLELPEIPLPDWAAGVRLGGPVTAPQLLAAVYDGLRLFAVLACIGAANSLADPRRLLKSLPASLYEVGVAVVVALSVTPLLIMELGEVRKARRLRGRNDRGLRGAAAAALPVLTAALERSLALAAAMDSRGYGRTRSESPRANRTAAVLTLVGLVGVLVGIYGLLDAGSPGPLGLPLLALGALAAVAGLGLGRKRQLRTRYRPDPWSWPEWGVAASGIAAAITMTALSLAAAPGLTPVTDPPTWPPLPPIAAFGLLLGLLPVWLAPQRPEVPLAPVAKRTEVPV
jgi:energy-coupling factor transport system permease protein